ncbi:MAG: ammonia-forming cytochrome c nitrite reductase subunit c552, partial [Myxococcota bacterium]
YRVTFIGAENSTGFHNPTEAGRILGDAIAFAGEAERYATIILTRRGVDVDAIKLDLTAYLNGRGDRKLGFKPEQEFRDPFGNATRFPGGR